ncbi:response regulator, partial [Paramuribaculum intestinale]|uniref:ATP-binding response regulator n=1 Tax=Paramuribaculum intestinale TaxID=2094151 RepID=UPI0025B42FCD
DFRKAQDGKEVRLATSCHDVKSRLTEICRRFEHPMDTIGKHISLIMPQQEVMAVFDVDKTDRVIMNLIGNAVKYSRSRVDVTLAEPKDGTVRILVADDGPGIAPHEREHIFDTYYQIGNDNLAASLGTGLGLTYAKLIACAHGGDITVDNNEYGGATFTLTFPAKYVSGDGHSVSAGAAAQAAAPLHSREISVLLVDDNRELLATVSDALRKSYTVYTAANAAEAIEMLELKDNIDVIISDFMMPGMSGAELCRKVKDDQRFGHIPFIILTAKTDTEAKVEGMACGADVYIEKPFAIRQLTLQIANIINTREQNMARVASAATGSAVTGVPLAADDDEPSLNRVDAEFLKTLDDYIRDNISEEEFSIDVMAKQM